MRSNRKGSSSAKPATEAPSTPGPSTAPVAGGERMQMLRKQLDETKARQEAELRSRRELESIVTGLQRELEERDAMIAGLHLSSVTSSAIGSPFVMSPEHGSPGDSPGSTTPPTGADLNYDPFMCCFLSIQSHNVKSQLAHCIVFYFRNLIISRNL